MKIIKVRFRGNYVDCMVDDDDYDSIAGYRWYLTRGAPQHDFYINKKRKHIYMHRFIMNPPTGVEVDHIDHNKLNNQKLNLRFCTHAENLRNRRKFNQNTSSKYTGVSLHKNQKWRARISVNSKEFCVGFFKNEIDAAIARDNWAKKIYGEFANLNITI